MRKSAGTLLGALFLLAGCKDVDRFSTAADESYCGNIVLVSIVRRGFASKMCLRMTLDTRDNEHPGLLWSDEGMFNASPLRPIPELFHDPLLTLSFGEGREKNLLYGVDPADPASGPTLFAVISLMHSGDTEVRLLRGAGTPTSTLPTPDGGTTGDGAPLFGVFAPMERQKGACRTFAGCNWMPE